MIWAELCGGPLDGQHAQLDENLDGFYIFARGPVPKAEDWRDEELNLDENGMPIEKGELLEGFYERDRSNALDPTFHWKGWE